MLHSPAARTTAARIAVAHCALMGAVVSVTAAHAHAFDVHTIVPLVGLVGWAGFIGLYPWQLRSHHWIAKIYFLGAGWFVYFAIHFDNPYLLLGMFPEMIAFADVYSYRRSLLALHEAALVGAFIAGALTVGGTVATTLMLIALPLMTMNALIVGTVSHRFIQTLLQREQFQSAVTSLLEALQARDGYTGDHSRETLAMAMAVADELELGATERKLLADTALLHDIGKIGIPNAILQKPGKLTDDEWAVMKEHPVVGEQILRDMPGFEAVARAVRHEHERWDGQGYPDGISGEEIPIASRIVLACDAFHAMTSDRPYRKAMSVEEARAELRLNAGSQFDPRVVEALDRAIAASKIDVHSTSSDSQLAAIQREYGIADAASNGVAAPVMLAESANREQRRSKINDPHVMIAITSANWAVIATVLTAYLLANPPLDTAGIGAIAAAGAIALVGLLLLRFHGAPRWWSLYGGLLGYAAAVLFAAHFDEPTLLMLALGPSITASAFFWHRTPIKILQSALAFGVFVAAPVLLFGWDVLAFSATALRAFPGTVLLVGHFVQKLLEMRFERQRFTGTMTSLLLALEARDGYTSEHSDETLAMAMLVADQLDLDEGERLELKDVALLHDIGKIGIPDEILNKPGALDEREWETMRRHPVIGEQIVARVPGFESVARAIRHEHERWDGQGYPDGISGEEIPLASRIVLVCDAYHAMTSDRPYRKAMDESAARAELVNCSGTQFDPRVVGALLAALDERDASNGRLPLPVLVRAAAA